LTAGTVHNQTAVASLSLSQSHHFPSSNYKYTSSFHAVDILAKSRPSAVDILSRPAVSDISPAADRLVDFSVSVNSSYSAVGNNRTTKHARYSRCLSGRKWNVGADHRRRAENCFRWDRSLPSANRTIFCPLNTALSRLVMCEIYQLPLGAAVCGRSTAP